MYRFPSALGAYLMLAIDAVAAQGTSPAPSITIEKSGCFGTCPAYRLELHADDSYEWFGRAHVTVTGAARGELPAGTFSAVMARLESVDYRAFSDSYATDRECPEWWTDAPEIRITVMTSEGTKSIRHYLGCRGFPREVELLALESSLDRLLDVPEMDGTAQTAQEPEDRD